jgi:hypothetical protein
MSFPKIKYQFITINVISVGQIIPLDAELDKLYNTCTGINAILTDDKAKFSKLKLDINGREIFPDKFEVLRIKFRENAPHGYDFHLLNEPAAGTQIKGSYTDQAGVTTYPYQVVFAFRLENIEHKENADTGKI